MKVKYEFEINKQEYHKVLCEGCPMLYDDGHDVICWLSDEYYNKSMFNTESARIARLSELMAKCPLEVVE